MVRAGVARRASAGLGNAAVRPLLAASGPRVRATRDDVPRVARRMRCARSRGNDRAVSAGSAELSGGIHVLPRAGRNAGRRRAARAVGAGRVFARDAGGLAGRVQRPRRAHRSLPDGIDAAVSHRSLRYRDRDHQDVRRRYPAHALSGPERAPAAGARISAGRGRAHPFSQPLSRSVRRRSVEIRAVQGHLERHRPRRHRYYLPLFFDTTATIADYLPPTRRSRCTARSGAVDRFWQDTESRYRPLRGGDRRGRCCLDGTVPSRRCIQRRRQEVRPHPRLGGEGAGPTAPLPPVRSIAVPPIRSLR